ncbi:hypothetical protein Bca4012_010844 [Brassica carinata]|uniref:Phytocyanin domain-containing protein n=1 Tax=Brassica carinata TaxID=52824 RepID=A0A8X7S191_BRACI|nr:hypothetical protein Bca52824_035745 [Brassica carinata]
MVALKKSLCFSFIILASLATLFSAADARRFYVGGSRGWVMNPRERYNTWAERNRFQVNDTLYFKYAKGSDSVQQVMKADYEGCNIRNPLEKYDNGESEVKLNRSGPFFFISGNQDHCLKGQKLIVVVLAVRHPKKVPVSPAQPPKAHSPVSPVAPAKAPSTAQPPKAHSPVSPVAPARAPSTVQPPKSHSPVSPVAPAKGPSTAEAPKAHSPVSPPAKAPSTTQPPKSHAPVSPVAPSKAPSTADTPKAHSPVSPAAPAKAPSTVEPPKAHSPVSPAVPANAPSTAQTPDHSPASPAPENTPPSSPTPPQSTPADNINAPAASTKNAASGVAVTSVMTTVLSAVFTVLMFA